MKEFDIYLRRHLVECDLLVYSIPFREGISVTDRLIFEAALNGYTIQKLAAVQMESNLTAHIDQMIKLCLERLHIETGLDVEAEFKAYTRLNLDHAPLKITTSEISTLARIFSEMEDGIALAVKPLTTQTSKYIGMTNHALTADAKVTDVIKRSLLCASAPTTVKSNITQICQIDHIGADTEIVAAPTLNDLCYQLSFDAKSAVEIVSLVLGTEIRHSLGAWYNSTAIGAKTTGTLAQKYIAAQSITTLIQEATAKLIQVMYPDESATSITVQSLHTGSKRKRLLYELDDVFLDGVGEMTLQELDYVILEE